MIIKGFKNVAGFLTAIPVAAGSIEETAKYMYLFPIAGALIALIAASAGYLTALVFPNSIAVAIALLVLLLLTGLHHLDGLLDFGDALMFRGSAEKRVQIMHDKNTGAGGFSIGFFALLLTYLALAEVESLFSALVVAEASAKFSMIIGAYLGRPSHEGTGSAFIKIAGRNHKLFLLSLIIYCAIILPFENNIVVLFITYIFSLAMIYASNKLLGGVSGDVFGAMNELTRMLVLLVLVV
ncbi:MAG: adenosylcobinamide-GDP ribazoletransferase [Candidatus Hydrothermarchaeota archaeon]|nr:adenosylcobinamide-GDP ribazoletransferase [Candidatus Hydrothermarchaeota archaeon]